MKKTKWIYRFYAIVPISEQGMNNAFWTLVAPGGDPEAKTFGVDLSPTGLAPATASGISSAFTAEILAKLKVIEAEMETLAWYLCDAWTFELLEQRGGAAEVGKVLDWQGALDNAELAIIQPEELP